MNITIKNISAHPYSCGSNKDRCAYLQPNLGIVLNYGKCALFNKRLKYDMPNYEKCDTCRIACNNMEIKSKEIV